jgi:hypothetical protein
LPLAHDLRVEATVPIPRHLDLDGADIGGHLLVRVPLRELPPLSPAGSLVLVAAMLAQLGLQRRLQHLLAHPAQQPVRPGQLHTLSAGLGQVWAPEMTFNTTTAALFRMVSDGPITIMYDEVDTVFNPKNGGNYEDLRALLNAGYKRSATVARCVGDAKAMKVQRFPVYAPAALAGIAGGKRAFFLAAFAALSDPTSHAYYDRKRAEGKKHNAALICLARRRCDVLYAMLRDKALYQARHPNRLDQIHRDTPVDLHPNAHGPRWTPRRRRVARAGICPSVLGQFSHCRRTSATDAADLAVGRSHLVGSFRKGLC